MGQPLWWHVVRAIAYGVVFMGYAVVVFVLVGLPVVVMVKSGMWQLAAVFVGFAISLLADLAFGRRVRGR